MSTGTNGWPTRKTLASQLDRLDNTIDALADGLNKAVADAVRQAVQETVAALVREVLSRPELIQRLAGEVFPVATPDKANPQEPSRLRKFLGWVGCRVSNAWRWLRTKVSNGWAWISEKARNLGRTIRVAAANGWRKTLQGLSALRSRLAFAKRFKWYLLTALGIGMGVGVMAWFAGPWVATALSGVGGFGSTLAVQAGIWWRRVFGLHTHPVI